MLGLRHLSTSSAVRKLLHHNTRLSAQIVHRSISKAADMSYEDIAAEFSAADNLLDVQKISADLYSDQDFLGW
jgi:hypothetical protein